MSNPQKLQKDFRQEVSAGPVKAGGNQNTINRARILLKGHYRNVGRVFRSKKTGPEQITGWLKLQPDIRRRDEETFDVHSEYWRGNYSTFAYERAK